MKRAGFFRAPASWWEYVGYAEIHRGFKGIMNLRVLSASAQAPQRSNGNDFPHNASRPEGGGGGLLLKEDGGDAKQPGVFCVNDCTHFPHAFHL